jgi:hypothetical protein
LAHATLVLFVVARPVTLFEVHVVMPLLSEISVPDPVLVSASWGLICPSAGLSVCAMAEIPRCVCVPWPHECMVD